MIGCAGYFYYDKYGIGQEELRVKPSLNL